MTKVVPCKRTRHSEVSLQPALTLSISCVQGRLAPVGLRLLLWFWAQTDSCLMLTPRKEGGLFKSSSVVFNLSSVKPHFGVVCEGMRWQALLGVKEGALGSPIVVVTEGTVERTSRCWKSHHSATSLPDHSD